MRNVILITKREYLTQVKKKSFVALTLMGPILLLLFGVAITYMFKANKTHYNIAVADYSGIFSRLENTDDITYQYLAKNTVQTVKETLTETNAIDGLLMIPPLKSKDYSTLASQTKLFTNKQINLESRQKMASGISDEIRKLKIKDLGIDEYQIANLSQNFVLYTQNLKDKKKDDDAFLFGVKSVLAGLLMYATFMFIIIYGVRVMRSVLEEKNNRVVEIIISSVNPFELMMGKILGVTLVALTQFIIWISMTVVAAFFLNQKYTSLSAEATDSPLTKIGDLPEALTLVSHSLLSMDYITIISVFIFYFLLGYIFYSAIYAAVGSAVDNETETQQFTFFAILPLMLGLYGSFSIMGNPEGPLAFWLSIIPLTSPIAMIARIPFGVPIWQLLLSMSLMMASVLFMIFVAGKVYRVGILMYGNKASAREIWKWIKS
ncbi:ABC transporter permease [Elizabethkingia argentiflava]|uniref:ABC transporter permease n=1 Tax=Elizabethkingia argenteiflava TaxID=2681556 RepID=A0A845PT10_9FLAO|nr:ABC transporter permease [Elizabethkingia argenteiflava]NAW50171.1 ABC transporter permease [Elizabethkingia argenteiflava]